MNKKLLMVMGYQRSGTNALFDSIERGGGCIPMVDVETSEIYEQFDLRPEPEIREILQAATAPVLLKPVNETKKRSIEDVLNEYRDYEVKIVYVYRDPVHVFGSQVTLWPQFNDLEEFIQLWNKRNGYALNLPSVWKDHMAIVSYTDLISDPEVFEKVCLFLGVKGKYLFHRDQKLGFHLPDEIQKRIETETKHTWDALEANRTFKAEKHALSVSKIYRNFVFVLKKYLPSFLIARVRREFVTPASGRQKTSSSANPGRQDAGVTNSTKR
ncbi:sulfotransferase [bacterium]|nr:sulfotransferase [bacterium]